MIGLIFGETKFPIKILKKVKKRYLRYLIIDLTGKKKFKSSQILKIHQDANLYVMNGDN